jgi:uncharacterized protein YhaN
MTKVCIIHQKPSDGVPVKDDVILKTIRKIKRAFKISTGNQLVVCKAHLEEARKKRSKFEKSLMTAAGIGALFGIIMLVVSILSQKSIFDILRALVLLVFLVVVMASLSLYQYFPALEEGPKRKVAAVKAKPTRAKRIKRR